MNKYLLTLLLFSSSAFAVDLYQYNPIEGCSLRKAVGGGWQVAPATEVGQDSFPIQSSKANAAYSNFKYQGVWYAARTECFKMAEAPSGGSSESVESVGGSGFHFTKGKLFVEPKFSFYIMTGSKTGAGADTTTGITYEKYSPSLGIAAKVGYYLSSHTDIFLEINRFAGSRNAISGGVTAKIEDSVMSFNLGYQYFFSKMGSFLPYGELALGYNSLSQKQTPSTGTALEFTGSGIGFVLEGGVLYELSSKIALTGALNYTAMSFSKLKMSGATNEMDNTVGHSHIGINIGARYNF